jgi:ubiquinone/menaquinone biosynthesis C-methylase UbiE
VAQAVRRADVRRVTSEPELPEYAPTLAALHRACEHALRGIVAAVPVEPGARVLDVACGDGVYSTWFAELVGPTGRVTGVDLDPAYLELAHTRTLATAHAERVSFRAGDVSKLPFETGSFDVVWCAHSLYSLDDPLAALTEMRRVAAPGGRVAVLENDTLHYLLMPWPPELELAVQQAQLAALIDQSDRPRKYYVGRMLNALFRRVGLGGVRLRTFTIDHQAPLDVNEREFLLGYLRELRARVRPYLKPGVRAAFDAVLDPRSAGFLLDRPEFFTAHLEILALGTS